MTAQPELPGGPSALPPVHPAVPSTPTRLGGPAWTALLPLAWAGLYPLWVCALLGGVIWLGGRSEAWRGGRFLTFLLVLGVAAALQLPAAFAAGEVGALAWGLSYLLWILGALLLHAAVGRTEDGSRGGALLALVPGLLLPTPGLLPALAGALLGRTAPDDRSPQGWQGSGAGYRHLVLGGLLGAALLGALLPATRWRVSYVPLPRAAASAPVSPSSPPEVMPQTEEPGRLPVRLTFDRSPPLPPEGLYFGVGALLLGALAAQLLRQPGGMRKGEANPLADYALTAGLLLTGLLFVLAGILARSGLSGADSGNPGSGLPGLMDGLRRALRSSEDAATFNLTGLVVALAWLGLAGVVVLGLALWLLRERRPAEAAGLPPAQEAPALGGGHESPLPVHRVRLAYRSAEGALAGAGYPRGAAETAAAYTARLAGAHPGLALSLPALSRAYAPVRYGGAVSEASAAEAEAAAQEVRAWCALNPVPPEETP